MRKISQEAADAFNHNESYNESNTCVSAGIVETVMYLHGNAIAKCKLNGRNAMFTLAGWPTPTTRERLRGLGIDIRQKKGKQYLITHYSNGKENWNNEIDPNKWYDTEGNEVQA